MMNIDKLIPGQTIDLYGQTAAIAKSLYVPPGNPILIRNGSIDFAGNGATTGSPSMAPFYLDQHSAPLSIQGVKACIGHCCAVVHTDTGGRVSLTDVMHMGGSIAWCMGADEIDILRCYPTGMPDKYWFANFTHLLRKLRIDNTGCPHSINQGANEAAVRLMQTDDAIITSLIVHGSGFKQAVQSRPGGFGKPQRDRFHQHVWRLCTITGGANGCFDAGNFKDKTDSNFPFGTLDLLELDGCTLDGFELTTQGGNALTWDQMGIRQVKVNGCRIGGKLVNETITK